MANKREIERNIERLKNQKKENISKMKEASSSNDRRHYRMLADKNLEMINHYRGQIEK